MGLFTAVHDVVGLFAAGKMVLIVDDERENEGDVCVAAERITAAAVTFMATQARGLICMPIAGQRLDELQIPLMVPAANGIDATPFTVTVDAVRGVTTGISAADRAETVRTILDSTSRPEDFIKPGHLFPLRYTEGGVLRRAGHTEASVDLAKLAGLYPAAVICEVMNDDGTMATGQQLKDFACHHGLPTISVSQIIEYRRRTEHAADAHSESRLPVATPN